MISFRIRKTFFLALLLSMVSLLQIQSTAATDNPLLLLDYEEIDDQHFAVSTYISDVNSLSVVSFPIAYNPEAVQVCGYDSEAGVFVDIQDGVIPMEKSRSSKCGLEYSDSLFASDKWAGSLICNSVYPYISNKEGLIKLTMYTLNDKYSFEGQNEFIKIYFKRISDEPAEIRIATKFNSEHYDKASSRGATFLNMTDVLYINCQFNGDVFLNDVTSTPVVDSIPDEDGSDNVEPDKEPEQPEKDEEEKDTPSGGADNAGTGSTSTKEENTTAPDEKDDPSEQEEPVKEEKIVFSDVEKSFWAYEPISVLAEKKMINGYEDGTFRPNGSITRAELATIVVKAKDAAIVDDKKVFSDSEISQWFNKYLVTAYEAGFISGYPDGAFKPDNLISRQDLCVVLAKAFLSEASVDNGELTFADSGDVDAYAMESVKKIAAAGIVKGRDGNIFAPKANATRAEVARMIYLCLDLAK